MKSTKPLAVITSVFLLFLGVIVALPVFALAVVGAAPRACDGPVEVVDDGTPSILGPSTLTVTDLRGWWHRAGRGQPRRLAIPIDDLIALYLSEGEAEDVRGDLAFAQAIVETGYFTNSDTAINNFAGIAHYDGVSAGTAFANPLVGVRAQIQLLRKYAAGNGAQLANLDVSPDAGASATTWGGLAGTWASSTMYWTVLESVYRSMSSGGAVVDAGGVNTIDLAGGCPSGELATSGDYALPLERRWYDEHPDRFTQPHHDYPAVDIPVPVGTPLYAVTSGAVVSTPASGRCGIGVVINGVDGAQYTYCHGLPGSHAISVGDRVSTGQFLMDSASTGNSTGPHLHFAINAGGVARCPQTFLVAIVEGHPLAPEGLPTRGCTS